MSNASFVLTKKFFSLTLPELAGTTRATSSLGGSLASVAVFASEGYPVKYTDPDGEFLINNVARGAPSARDYIENYPQDLVPSHQGLYILSDSPTQQKSPPRHRYSLTKKRF
jgi:hypothetical protein